MTMDGELFASLSKIIDGARYRDLLANRLSRAVKIPTVVGDGMGLVGSDSSWDIFYQFSAYLKSAFPLVCKHLKHTIINEHGHILTWNGSNSELKPLLLMAHSDVVPVSESSTDTWTHDPFSGIFDGEYIWGRGSEDDKSNLVAILSVIELLLQDGSFEPQRTIIFAIGFDEEGGADQSQGARCIAQNLTQIYGENGIELIFDEGMAGVESKSGVEIAYPATAEKGYLDVTLRIDTPGGHSQEPPKHTGVGLLAQAVTIIEDNPFEPVLLIENPAVTSLQMTAKLDGPSPSSLPKDCLDETPASKLSRYMSGHPELRSMIQTSTAVTVIHGGDKVNSLPESAYAVSNHRIAPHDTVDIVKDHYISLLKPWAESHKLGFNGFGRILLRPTHSCGTLTLTSEYDLDPSPVSPADDPHFRLLAKSIHTTFGAEVLVSPTILLGNTDTRYYWDLTRHIYRMSPWRQSHDPRGTRMHTVDERMPITGLLEMARFYLTFILDVDEYRS